MNTLTPPAALVHRFPLLLFLLLVFPGTTPSVRAEKPQITITQVLPLVNTDAGGTAGDHADVMVRTGGTARPPPGRQPPVRRRDELAQRIPAPELESAMASLHPLPGSVLYFDPLGLLRLVPDRTRTNVLLTLDAASDPQVLDTLCRSSDLRRWSVVGTFPGRVGGGVLEDLQLISGRAATSASDGPAGRTQTPLSMCSTAPPPPFPSPAPKPRSRDLLATGLTLRGFAAGRSTSRTSWPPLNDKPPIRVQIDSD